MDYPCVKFSSFSFSRFGFIVRTDRQTDRHTKKEKERERERLGFSRSTDVIST